MVESLAGKIGHGMGRRRPCISAVLMMFTALLVGCVTTPATHTQISRSWKAHGYTGKFTHLLVVSHAADSAIRVKVESILVNHLEKAGLHAVASSAIMPADEKINRKTIGEAMAGKGFDGVLVSRLLDVNRNTIDVPPSEDASLEDAFDADDPVVFTPGYVEHLSVISIQTKLYIAKTKRLVWSLQTQTVNNGTVNDLVQSLSQAVIDNLRARDLI